MRKNHILALAVLLAAATLPGVAMAGDAVQMSDEEMDNVTAAGPGNSDFGLSHRPSLLALTGLGNAGFGLSHRP